LQVRKRVFRVGWLIVCAWPHLTLLLGG